MAYTIQINKEPSKQEMFSVALLRIVHGIELTVEVTAVPVPVQFDTVLSENKTALCAMYTYAEAIAIELYALRELCNDGSPAYPQRQVDDCVNELLDAAGKAEEANERCIKRMQYDKCRIAELKAQIKQLEQERDQAEASTEILAETIPQDKAILVYHREVLKCEVAYWQRIANDAIVENACLKKQVAALQAQVRELQAPKVTPVVQPAPESDLSKLTKPLANLLRPFF